MNNKDIWAEEIYAFLVALFILLEVGCSAVAIFLIRLSRGINGSMGHTPPNMIEFASSVMMLMPSLCFLGLIFISYAKRAWFKNIAISILIMQVLTSPFFVMLIKEIETKRGIVILITISIGSSVLFWLLFPAIFHLRNLCGHFQK